MSLSELFVALADVFDGPHEIERFAAEMLRTSASSASLSDPSDTSSGLPASVLEEMSRPDAHPVCALIARMPFSGPADNIKRSGLYCPQHPQGSC